jgi:MFS family permease
MVVVFLFLTAPCTLNLGSYTQITIGAFFTTISPTALLFGPPLTYPHLLMFLALLSLGEALSSPKIYSITFDFARPGREGMFLALSAAPFYLTMGVSGGVSGWLLDKYYPPKVEDRQTDYIWVTLIVASGISLILLILFRPCFTKKSKGTSEMSSEEEEEGGEGSDKDD